MIQGTVQHWLTRYAAFHADVLRAAGGGARHLHRLRENQRYGLTADLAILGVDPESCVDEETFILDLGEPEFTEIFEDEPEFQEEEFETEEDTSREGLDPVVASRRRTAAAAARKIYFKQKGDPYNRETTVGFPIIAARLGSRELCGPLLYWPAELSYDAERQRLTVTRPSPVPVLNTILLSKFSEDATEIDLAREQLLPLILSEGFSHSLIDRVIDSLKGIFGPLRLLRQAVAEDPPLGSFFTQVSGLGAGSDPIIGYVPVLVNGARSYAFLLDDLDKLTKQEEAPSGSVINTILGPPAEPLDDEQIGSLPFHDTAEGARPLWFPEKSNKAQRRVARKAQRARVMTVQGPPGTGKSLTIANLVCDLVTEGKTVLVTSHTRKALEVVSKLLPRVDKLGLPILGKDRESLAKLRTELESVQESGEEDIDALRADVSIAETRLRELDQELRNLDRRFSELRRIEHGEYSQHNRLADIASNDVIDAQDRPDYDDSTAISAALSEYAHLAYGLAPGLDLFESLYRPEGSDTTRSKEALRQQHVCRLLEIVEEIQRPLPAESLELADKFSADPGSAPTIAAEFDLWAHWLDGEGKDLARLLNKLNNDPGSDLTSLNKRLLNTAKDIGSEALSEEMNEWSGLQRYFANTSIRGDELGNALSTADRVRLRSASRILRTSSESRLRWLLLPSSRRARAQLEQSGYPVPSRPSCQEALEELDSILDWHERADTARERAAAGDGALSVVNLGPLGKGATSRGLAAHAAERTSALRALNALLENPLANCGSDGLHEYAEAFLTRLSEDVAADLAGVAAGAASRLRELSDAVRTAEGLDAKGEWVNPVNGLVAAVQRREVDAAARKTADRLHSLAADYPHYRRFVDLRETELAGLPRTLKGLRAEVAESGAVPGWVEEADVAIEAHRLSQLLRQSLKANPDDLTEIAQRLSEGQTKRRRIILEVVRRRRRLAVAQAARSPTTHLALLKMRDLLRKKRLTRSLLALRDRIEYSELLKVFPCWICSIDDVARLFPLSPSLFDYLILDEASQCAQPTLLPLTFRAKHVVVVGDRKQLQPAAARFLSEKNLALLAQRHGIADHDKAIFFDGRKSVLEVADSCSQAFDFLDEHFRCDPAIIRWSNDKFYGNRLKILTHRRDGAFIPSLEVRNLTSADDDRETKVNQREAEAVIRELRRLVESERTERMTLGVISPYRKQANLLNEMIEREFAAEPNVMQRRGLLASTADGFQGDERDIIIYSFRYGPSSSPGVVRAIENEEERLNVAFTRPKRLAVLCISNPIDRFPQGLIRSFLAHAQEVQTQCEAAPPRPDRFDSDFERRVCQALRDRGLRVVTQEPCAGFFIDLMVEDGEGRVIGVECDGQWKETELGELRPEDYQRQDILERAGWVIHRISGRSFFSNPEREINRVVEALRSLPTAIERSVATGPRTLTSSEEGQLPIPEDTTAAAVSEEAERERERVAQSELEIPEVAEEEPEDSELWWLGQTQSARIVSVKALWRWCIMEANVELEGSAIDALSNIEDKLEKGQPIDESEQEFLQALWFSSLRRGFDPEQTEELPESTPPEAVGDQLEASADSEVRSPPAAAWADANLSEINQAILGLLQESLPRCRTKHHISGHLVSELRFRLDEADPRSVNRLLYGELSEWVEKRGDKPPCWTLRNR